MSRLPHRHRVPGLPAIRRLVLVGIVAATACGLNGASLHAADAPPPANTGVVELQIPQGATATVAGRTYRAGQSIEFKPFAPGAWGRYDFVVSLPGGRTVARTVLLTGGRRAHLSIPAEGSGARPELVLQTGHTSGLTCIAYSPDGTRFLSGSDDSQAILWDLATGRILRTFAGNPRGHQSRGTFVVKFFPDNRRILTAGAHKDGTEICVWDAGTGEKLKSILSPYVVDVMLSDDGRRILAGQEEKGRVSLYDVSTGAKLKGYRLTTSTDESSYVNDVAFHPTGRQILTADMPGKNQAVLWDAETGQRLRTFTTEWEVESVAFTPDGKRALTMGANAILWDLATGKEIGRFDIFASWAAFSPDGNRVVLRERSSSEPILWDMNTREQIHSNFRPNQLNAVEFSADSKRLLAALGDNFDDPTADDPPRAVIFEAETAKALQTIEGIPNWEVTDVRFNPAGDQFVTGLNSRTAYQYAYLLRKDPQQHSTSACVVWDQKSGQPAHVLRQPNYIFRSAVYNWDGTRLAVSGNSIHGDDPVRHQLFIWDALTGQQVRSYSTFERINLSGFSKDGNRLVGVDTGTFSGGTFWWDTNSDKDEMIGPEGASGAAISPDGRRILISGFQKSFTAEEIRAGAKEYYADFYDAATGKRIRSLEGRAPATPPVVYSPSGRLVATGSKSEQAHLWNSETGAYARSLTGHASAVACITFSSDDQLALTGSADGTAKLWDVATGRIIHTFRGHGNSVIAVDFSGDRRFVITGCADGVSRIWDVSTGDLLLSLINFLTPQGQHDWIALTPEGLFDGSAVGRDRVSFRAGGPYTVVPADRFFQDFYRSGLISLVLGAGAVPAESAPPATAFQSTLPPKLKIVRPTDGFLPDSDQVTIEVEGTDEGGGITGPSLRHNGARVLAAGEAQREGKIVRQTFIVRLVEGENRIRIEAASSDGSWESEPAKLSIPFAKSLPKPRLYVLAVGVNDYVEASFNLRFAVPDAESIAQLFRERSKALYESVHVDTLINDKATKKNIREALKEIASEARPQDTLLVFLSGHGFTVGQRYYYLPHEFKSESEQFEADVRKWGLPGDELADAIGAIPALKRMLILDTCNSGAAIGKAGGQARNPFAFRGAVERLSRAQGIFTIAAASASEDTVEIPKLKHGVLTYALLAALKGVTEGPLTDKAVKPTNADQVIGVLEWFSFASGEVPRLTREFLGREQDVKMSGEGTSFPVLPLETP